MLLNLVIAILITSTADISFFDNFYENMMTLFYIFLVTYILNIILLTRAEVIGALRAIKETSLNYITLDIAYISRTYF